MSSQQFSERVLHWHQQHGRKHLPWQRNITPYRVWVSEIMLQQTQVATVIPYFERFMQRFPSINELADADIDDVLHLWTGLGYYARGRNLHACAKLIVNQYGGEFPRSVEALSQLPGIGRSTAGAIASISMGLAASILDGNVKRVLTRYFAIEGWPSSGQVEKQLWVIAEQLTPQKNTATYTQAMMDLGATLCTRSKPNCAICPLQKDCQGFATGNPTQFPHSKPKTQKPSKQTFLLLIKNTQGDFLLEQQPSKGIWGGLWSMPQASTKEMAFAWLSQYFPAVNYNSQLLSPFRHTFSHYHLDISPLLIQLKSSPLKVSETDNTKQCWYNPKKPIDIGLPAPIKKLLKEHS